MFKKKIFLLLNNWWITIDKRILFSYFILLFLGLIFVFTASSSVANRINVNEYYFFKHQLFFIIISSFILLLTSLLPDNKLKKLVKIMFIFAFTLLLMVKFFGFQVKGAKRWIYIFNISIQPTEILKPILIILNAYILEKFNENNNFKFLIVSFSIYSLCSFLIYKQPDIGTLILISIVFFTQFFLLDYINFKKSLFIAIFISLLVFISYIKLPHVNNRINNFIKSFKDPNNINYQVKMSISAYKHGDILGRGFLEGEIKNYIPDAHTDFIFPAITEEFGFIVVLIIISLYFFIAIRVILIANLEDDYFKFLSLYGLALLFLFQAVINIGVSLNLLPTKGMTLPLLSYGGSSLIGSSLNIAFILILTKKTFKTKSNAENTLDLSYFKK